MLKPNDVRVGGLYIEDPTGQRIVVEEIKPRFEGSQKLEVFFHHEGEEGLGVWWGLDLFCLNCSPT